MKKDEIIRPRDDPFGADGGVAVLYGNLAPGGAMIKTFSVPKEMHVHTGRRGCSTSRRRPSTRLSTAGSRPRRRAGHPVRGTARERHARDVLRRRHPVRRSRPTAIVTDGRYSGAMKGPCVGHVAPEAIDGGPIALVAEGDLIELNAPERRLSIVGTDGEHRTAEDVAAILADRKSIWKPPRPRHDSGMALLLAAAREICAYNQATHAGTWRWQTGYPIHRLRGGVVGLLSFGAIAQAIAARAEPKGSRRHVPLSGPTGRDQDRWSRSSAARGRVSRPSPQGNHPIGGMSGRHAAGDRGGVAAAVARPPRGGRR